MSRAQGPWHDPCSAGKVLGYAVVCDVCQAPQPAGEMVFSTDGLPRNVWLCWPCRVDYSIWLRRRWYECIGRWNTISIA